MICTRDTAKPVVMRECSGTAAPSSPRGRMTLERDAHVIESGDDAMHTAAGHRLGDWFTVMWPAYARTLWGRRGRRCGWHEDLELGS